mgnify:CR=1 FL=1
MMRIADNKFYGDLPKQTERRKKWNFRAAKIDVARMNLDQGLRALSNAIINNAIDSAKSKLRLSHEKNRHLLCSKCHNQARYLNEKKECISTMCLDCYLLAHKISNGKRG